jgi:hypothetical protein
MWSARRTISFPCLLNPRIGPEQYSRPEHDLFIRKPSYHPEHSLCPWSGRARTGPTDDKVPTGRRQSDETAVRHGYDDESKAEPAATVVKLRQGRLVFFHNSNRSRGEEFQTAAEQEARRRIQCLESVHYPTELLHQQLPGGILRRPGGNQPASLRRRNRRLLSRGVDRKFPFVRWSELIFAAFEPRGLLSSPSGVISSFSWPIRQPTFLP